MLQIDNMREVKTFKDRIWEIIRGNSKNHVDLTRVVVENNSD
jgi:hypothetical protein